MFIRYPEMGRGVPENGYPYGKKMFIRYPKMGRGVPENGYQYNTDITIQNKTIQSYS